MGIPTIHTQSAAFGGYATRACVRPGPGPTVLCLHGFSDNADGWRPLFNVLAGSSAHLVALDLPGFGEGPPLAPRPARLLDQVTDFAVAAARHYARRGPLILVGHSLGGRVALTVASRLPDAVTAVVALAPAPLRLRLWARTVTGERLLLPAATRLLRHLPERALVRHFVAGYRRTFFDPSQVDADIFARYRAYCSGQQVVQYIGNLHRIGGELGTPLDLTAVHQPVDLLWGREDRLVPPAAATEYRRRLPQARYLEIIQCGHAIPQERPPSVARVLRQRLADPALGWGDAAAA